MQSSSIRDRARKLVDLMERVYVCRSIERGLEDSRDGRTLTIGEVWAQFELEP